MTQKVTVKPAICHDRFVRLYDVLPTGYIDAGEKRLIQDIPHRQDECRKVPVGGFLVEDDIEKAKGIIEEIIKSESRILNTPEYLIAVGELADSSVNIYVRPWVSTSNYWPVKFDLTERIKLEFDKNGISIPYPQMDVHIDNEKEEQKPE